MARKKSKDTTVEVPVQATAEPPQGDAPANRTLLHDWAPLGQCLTQRIGRHYWLRHAADLFADETVPHWVHDNGAMSQRTAHVLIAWCQERQSAGTLPDQIVVCEIGMGTGLHLKYMLDAFRQHCRDHNTDWYTRLQALGSDVSAPVARKAQERGLFADHAGHVRLGHLDVEAPDTFIELDTGIAVPLVGQVHVFVALYVLDLLGVDVFRRRNYDDGGRWEAVWVRTWLRNEALLPAYTEATVAQLQELATQDHPDAMEPLAQVWSLIQEELRAWPVAMAEHPDSLALQRLADDTESALGRTHPLLTDGTVVIHSAGALRAVQLLSETVAQGGIVLLRDVGLHTPEAAATARGLTHYGQVSAAAVNLVQLDAWMAAGHCPGVLAVAPSHDGQRGQCGRLLVKGSLPATESAFRQAFDSRAIFASHALLEQAATQTDAAQALELVRQAIAQEPTDWTLHLDAARLALHGLHRPDVAHVVALRAVELNPAFSPDLWCVLGDALHALGEADKSVRAYRNALAVHPRHAQSLWSLAYVQAEAGRHGEAFELLGQAMRWDKEGQWRSQVLQLLDACLRAQSLQRQAELARLAEQAGL